MKNEIVEINSFQELMELSAAGAGAVAGAPAKTNFKKKEEEDDMIKREDIVVENLLRQHIRNKIKEKLISENKKRLAEEESLRTVIRKLIKEGDISDIHPHRSTGINVLEDLLKKMIPTLRTDYKRLTTNKSQRDSFRAHLVKAIKDSLLPLLVNDEYLQSGEASGALLSAPEEPASEPETGGLEDLVGDEADKEIELSESDTLDLAEVEIELGGEPDSDKKIPVEDDDKPTEEEDFGIEGEDETGRNMSFSTFKKVQQYVLDAYDMLANPEDKKIFIDYLITNVKLYFDKFEDELQKNVEEPTTPEYDKAKSM